MSTIWREDSRGYLHRHLMFLTKSIFILNLSQKHLKARMIGQSKISSFFKTGSTPKRPLSDSDDNPSKENKVEKKLKTEEVQAAVKPLSTRQGNSEVKSPKPAKAEVKPTKKTKSEEEPKPSTSWADPTSLIIPVTPTKEEGPSPDTPKEGATSSPKEGTTSSPKEDATNSPAGGDTSSPVRNASAVSPGAALSPEQKEKIASNQLQAKLKLTTTNTQGLVRDFGITWFKALQAEFTKPYFVQLSKFVSEERKKGTVFPPPHQVFSFTQASEIKDVKVVIIGQDPYHGTGQAHGLSFSVQKGIRCPPSLENMYKELINDIDGFKHPGHGNLTGWAQQGVLMLNACLTVKAHQANSHQGKGWEKFTDAVIAWFNTNRAGIVFILWGAYAQKKGAQINKKKHLILKGVHPSPLSAHRGFFGSKHFSQCNKYLKEHNRKAIDWTHLPEC